MKSLPRFISITFINAVVILRIERLLTPQTANLATLRNTKPEVKTAINEFLKLIPNYY